MSLWRTCKIKYKQNYLSWNNERDWFNGGGGDLVSSGNFAFRNVASALWQETNSSLRLRRFVLRNGIQIWIFSHEFKVTDIAVTLQQKLRV
jgi:hypothetical protein